MRCLLSYTLDHLESMSTSDNTATLNTKSLKGLKVLLVEDEPDIADLLTFVLMLQGAEVTFAVSAEEALGKLGAELPDVLVSNIKLPNEDGYWLIEQIRSLESHWKGQLPAIAVTSYTRDFSKDRALDAGFDYFLPKPVDLDDLTAHILTLVNQ
jgi:CheY-like chemotaxis protein